MKKNDSKQEVVVPFGVSVMVKAPIVQGAADSQGRDTTCRTGAPPNQGVDTDD